MAQPQFYVVGGAVRDAILGATPTDIDYVVVGATPEWMLENGYTQVGADFPVFLKDGQEYALARTERKTGAGYHGFDVNASPEITLEQDLSRRDITVNSMAVELGDWEEFLMLCKKHQCSLERDFLDTYVQNWTQHIFEKAIVANSGAFSEDPVRVLRAIRMRHTLDDGCGCQFVADDWDYGARTWKQMQEMTASSDFTALTPERLVQEVTKAGDKCRSVGQFVRFVDDLIAVGATSQMFDCPLLAFPHTTQDLDDVTIVQRPLMLAVIAMFMQTQTPATVELALRAAKYPTQDIAIAVSAVTILGAYGTNGLSVGRGLVNGKSVFDIIRSCGRNTILPVTIFLNQLKLLSDKYVNLLETALTVWDDISMASLTSQQQSTLVGPEIGAALWDMRYQALDDYIAEVGYTSADN